MGRADRVVNYCFLIFSFFIIEESWRMGVGNLTRPGPGFLPFGCGLIILALGSVQLVIARSQSVASTGRFFRKERMFKLVAVVVMCFMFGLLLEYLGFILCTGLFVLISLRSIEPQKWGKSVLISSLTAFIAWLIFVYWLQVQIPKGAWIAPLWERIVS
jgi:putative tricarboxylic transport membrane protein